MRNAYKYLTNTGELNPLERLKRVVTYMFQILHNSLIGLKPFNPIIGETYQCVIYPPNKDKKKEGDPLHVYAEQVCHHPPIQSWYAIHKEFKLHGYRETSAISSGNSVIAEGKGPFNIEFNDGSIITCTFPSFCMNGLLFGSRLYGYQGHFKMVDKKNNLTCYIDINPKVDSGFFSSLFGSSKKNFPDYSKGFICNTDKLVYDSKKDVYSCNKSDILSDIEGEYNVYLNIDGEQVWSLNEFPPGNQFYQSFNLESDSQNRWDLVLYRTNKIELSQYAKMLLEDIQRKDAKLRKANSKKN